MNLIMKDLKPGTRGHAPQATRVTVETAPKDTKGDMVALLIAVAAVIAIVYFGLRYD